MTLTTDSRARKETPLYSGVLKYFPLALAAIARVSKAGNDKHNPGQPLHWSREKSNDHLDCAARHLATFHDIDPENGQPHGANGAWRMLAELELFEEKRLASEANPTVVQTPKAAPVSFLWGNPADVTNGCAMPPPAREAGMPRELGMGYGIDVTNGYGMAPPSSGPRTMPPSPDWLIEGTRATNLKTGIATKNHHTTTGSTKAPFTFWYLATPYTRFPAGHKAAFNLAARLAAYLMTRSIPVFAPIAHSHPIAQYMAKALVTDHDLWMRMDGPLMEAASGLIVVTAESWETSKGMAEEIGRFTTAGKPVVYWDPSSSVPTRVMETAVL